SEILRFIKEEGGSTYQAIIKQRFLNCHSPLKALEKKGLIEVFVEKPVFKPHKLKSLPSWVLKTIKLNKDQKEIFKIILTSLKERESKVYLLHGATGSGKTEIYIELAKEALKQEQTALILVPEIALTPQIIVRFQARIKEPVAVLHSGLTTKERWHYWEGILKGYYKIVIGVRSAIFAPLSNLGLIIVDEEHDSSFKQSDNLRYNARDLAVVLGKLKSCPVLLGSATPSLESYTNTLRKKYEYLSLKASKELDPSAVKVVDLTSFKIDQMFAKEISPPLYEAISNALSLGKQVFLLFNRRGFASFVSCVKCKKSVICPNCSVTLTFHKKRNILLCHYCGHTEPRPLVCPICTKEGRIEPLPEMVLRGSGTERAWEAVNKLFKGAGIGRMDRDALPTVKELEQLLKEVREGKIKILVGTQMIAKGHDIPDVAVVGVIDCDVAMNIPDFRAWERTVQLLFQAMGRIRESSVENAKVILQTRHPKNPILQTVLRKDYLGFINTELHRRKALRYPPFCRLMRIIVSSREPDLTQEYAEKLMEKILSWEGISNSFQALGPVPAPLEHLRGRWRHHILIKSSSAKE
ncbi:MAG: primosomal protein N', partial [Candidatus Dadabacteria bacterium]